ncbi:hypothetical protein LSAT2_027624 [Lamellibrachia satsuma]|nr:hypothetical protein LSAT2_027624 [Lamellibrachia satsuma]
MDSTCQPTYQLKRIGKAATVPGVKDILVLGHDVTRFGRHSGNDHYLDSLELSYFISRWHAEVLFVRDNHGGKYVLRDNSLNGTYINGSRVKGNRALEEGDVVMFGHPCGKDIKPGQPATYVADSEFEFLFQKVDHLVTTSPVHLGSATYELPNSPIIGRVDWSPDHVKLSQRTPTLHTCASTVSRKILPSETGGKFLLKDISNIRCNSPGQLLHLDQLFNSHVVAGTNTSHLEVPQAAPAASDDSNDSEILQAAIESAATFGESDSEVDVLASQSPSPKRRKTHNGQYPWITSQLCQPTVSAGLGQSCSPRFSEPQQKTICPPGMTRRPATVTHPQDGLELSNTGTHHSSAPQEKTLVLAAQVAPLFGVPSSTSRTENGQNTAVATRKRKYKKRKQKFSRGRKTKAGGSNFSKWHDDGEQCDSYDCCLPNNDEISWVQCDDCDKWYHTACAGCNYNTVKQQTTEFRCGCT